MKLEAATEKLAWGLRILLLSPLLASFLAAEPPPPAKKEDPLISKPVIRSVYLPVLTHPQAVTLEGIHFLPQPDAPFEVRIEKRKVPATRVSDQRIELKSETLRPYFDSLGKEPRKEISIQVNVLGEDSNTVKLAIVNNAKGSIQGRVSLVRSGLPLTGAKVSLPDRQVERPVALDGSFSFSNLLPDEYRLLFEWPGVIDTGSAQTVIVRPGQVSTAKAISIKLPKPELKTITPERISAPETLVLRGKHFLHRLRAPYEVTAGSHVLRAIRVGDETIQIPTDYVAPLFASLRAGATATLKVAVTIAGVRSDTIELHIQRPAPPATKRAASKKKPPRDLASPDDDL